MGFPIHNIPTIQEHPKTSFSEENLDT